MKIRFEGKQAPVPPTPNPEPKFPINSVKITRKWNDTDAAYVYELFRYHYTNFAHTHFGWIHVASGDKAWATKNANHYGIEIQNDKPAQTSKEEK